MKCILSHTGSVSGGSLPSRERGLKYIRPIVIRRIGLVAPFTGAWIEINMAQTVIQEIQVAPFTGAWIEIRRWECPCCPAAVAPFTGAWIEIEPGQTLRLTAKVAPFTGAWIEIRCHHSRHRQLASLPSRERGLKSIRAGSYHWRSWAAPFTGAWIEMRLPGSTPPRGMVAPFTGAWIEMKRPKDQSGAQSGRSLHGSVD